LGLKNRQGDLLPVFIFTRLLVGSWQLAVGSWQLAVGSGQLTWEIRLWSASHCKVLVSV
jgi:hypothetical protein